MNWQRLARNFGKESQAKKIDFKIGDAVVIVDLVESGQLSLHSNYSGWILEVDSESNFTG